MSAEEARFPELGVRDLEGKEYVIPRDLPDGPHVIMLAFERWHQSAIERWKAPLERIAAKHPGMEIWEVPSLSRAYRVFRAGIDGGMRAGIPDLDVREHTLTAYTDLRELARDLELGSLQRVQIFVVDCDGRIVWRHSGDPDEGVLLDLEQSLPEACAET